MLTTYTNALAPAVVLNSPPSLSMFVSVNGAAAWFSGSLQIIAPSFVSLPPSATSFIYLNLLTSTVQVNQTGFTANFVPIATAVTSSFGITSLTDNRPDFIIGSAGGGGGSPNFADQEIPSGTINGSNSTFTLAFAPSPATSLELFKNGVLQQSGGGDFTLSGQTITFVAGSVPRSGATLAAWYRH